MSTDCGWIFTIAATTLIRGPALELSQGAIPGGDDMNELATYLQRAFDAERAAVANELHDVLGGLLVAAKIDVDQLERALADQPDAVRLRLATLRESLDSALALKRTLVEQ